MRIVGIIIGFFLFVASANAAVIPFDLTGMGTTAFYNPGCYCNNTIYYTPVVTVGAGDVVDFGRVTIHAYEVGVTPDAGPNQPIYFLMSYIYTSFNPPVLPSPPWYPSLYATCNQNDASCISTAQNASSSGELILGSSTGTVQAAWFGPYDYTKPDIASPVPEPSTWAMLLIGFAGIGFATHRRRRTERGSGHTGRMLAIELARSRRTPIEPLVVTDVRRIGPGHGGIRPKSHFSNVAS